MYGSSSAYPGYPSPAPPSTSLYSPPPPQDYYQQQQHNPYSQPSTSYHHQPYAQPPYVRAESPQIIPLAHQVNQDPNPIAFLTFYRRILDELTCNSKYIITNATIIASELLNRANDIARCLDDHIMQCHPEHRLYAMYALDSICKNVGAPYVTLLSETISRIFLETYRLVDQRNKMLMEQLLATWRDSGPNGSPLFGTDAQWNIERQIFGAPQPIGPRPQPQQVQQNLTPQHYPPPPPVPASSTDDEQQRAVMEIDRLLEIGSIEQSRNPENIKNRTRLDALSQLKAIVRSTAVSPIELNQINQQLAALSNEFRALQIQQQEQEQRQRFASPVPGGNGTPTHISSALAALSGLSRSSSSNVDTPPLRGTPLPEVMATNGNSAAANDLIKSLMQAGLLPGGSTPQSTSTSTDPQPELEVEDEDAAYTAALSSLSTSLTAISLSKTNPPRDLVLTSNSFLPLQCKQCANRYPDSKVGKKNLQTHLDWHFRQNRRSKESKARGMYRGWNAMIEDWIRGGHDDSPLQAGSSTEETSLSAISSAQQSHLKAQFDSSFVITPSDPEIASEPCPICKEPFKSEFSEDEEEWIWKGTIKENGVYYHASCHHSAKSLKESVAKDNNKRANSPSISSSGGGGRNSRNNTPKPDSPSSVTTSLPVNTSSESGLVSRLKQEEGVQNLSLSLNGNNRKRKAEDDEEVADQSTKAAQDSSSSPHQNGDDNATNRDGEMEQDHQKDEDSAPPAKKVAT